MSGTRVLLIEDDGVFSDLVSRFLSERGYQVSVAGDGKAGVAACQADPPDIVLCDLNLPKMSGLQVLESLLRDYPQLPLIVISASERMSDIRDAVRIGAWDYLVKPIDRLETIDVAIQNCLTRTTLEDSWEHERWELDDHIDVLFQNESMARQLVADLVPHEELRIGPYVITHQMEDTSAETHWVDYYRLPGNQAVAVIATAKALTGKDLVSLLVLKTLFNPIIRMATGGHQGMLSHPHKVLERLNLELCHSKIKTAFDMVVIWLDGESGSMHWGHAGDSLQLNVTSEPDLALGIWGHATYKLHQGHVNDGDKIRAGNGQCAIKIARRATASAA
ncbi:response regulator [Aliidiomarina sp. Khilg15.8]